MNFAEIRKNRAKVEIQPVPVWDPEFKAVGDRDYQQIRDELGEIIRTELPNKVTAWLVLSFPAMRRLLADERLSKDSSHADDSFHQRHPTRRRPLFEHLLTMDPPKHTFFRQMLQADFANARMDALRPRIEQIADDLIDALDGTDPFDLIEEFARPLPLRIICELIGVPGKDEDLFREWSSILVSAAPDEQHIVAEASENFRQYLLNLAETISDPDAIYTKLVKRRNAGEMTTDELVGMGFLLIVAGHETSMNFIGNGVLQLLSHEDSWRRLHRGEFDVDILVDELLRHSGPLETGTPWFAKEDIRYGSCEIRRGDTVFFAINGANRDEGVFHAGDKFDPFRHESRRHLAFLHGIHRCLGARLAKIESETAFVKLAQRFPDLRLAQTPESIVWRTGFMRGPCRLHVESAR